MVLEKESAVNENEKKKNKQPLFPHQNPSYSQRKSNLLNLRRSENEWPHQQTNAGDGDETRPECTKGNVYKEVKQWLGDGRLNLSLFFPSILTGALTTRLPCLQYEVRPMAVKKRYRVLQTFLLSPSLIRVLLFFRRHLLFSSFFPKIRVSWIVMAFYTGPLSFLCCVVEPSYGGC